MPSGISSFTLGFSPAWILFFPLGSVFRKPGSSHIFSTSFQKGPATWNDPKTKSDSRLTSPKMQEFGDWQVQYSSWFETLLLLLVCNDPAAIHTPNKQVKMQPGDIHLTNNLSMQVRSDRVLRSTAGGGFRYYVGNCIRGSLRAGFLLEICFQMVYPDDALGSLTIFSIYQVVRCGDSCAGGCGSVKPSPRLAHRLRPLTLG
ncbi:hypothetical protein EJ02DRAFT_150085 [Clathrospora elynae]|uniref:Uncharacterized protein n=1 Tax=Clathrospora elynae TaxID=706981 RepID=A0A6A5SV65_9PLEO|nr:hypothetical protein EJ02DRAFT_150085 [Clathrospora elynae]